MIGTCSVMDNSTLVKLKYQSMLDWVTRFIDLDEEP
jgi:hypothetical protein